MDSDVLYTWCYCCHPVPPRTIAQPSTDKARRPTGTLRLFFQPFQICYLNRCHPWPLPSSLSERGSRAKPAVGALMRWHFYIKSNSSRVLQVKLKRCYSHAICTTEGNKCCCLMVAQFKVRKALLSVTSTELTEEELRLSLHAVIYNSNA